MIVERGKVVLVCNDKKCKRTFGIGRPNDGRYRLKTRLAARKLGWGFTFIHNTGTGEVHGFDWCPAHNPERVVHLSLANCESALEASGVNTGWCHDSRRWQCPCGRVFVHRCDEADGCSWYLMEEPCSTM